MDWYLADPVDAGVFQGGLGVEALSDGAVDENGFLFVQQFDFALLFGDQGVDLSSFPVEEGDDTVLLRFRG